MNGTMSKNEWTYSLYECFGCPQGVDQFCIVTLFPCCVMSNAMDSIGDGSYILGFACGGVSSHALYSRDNTSKVFSDQ